MNTFDPSQILQSQPWFERAISAVAPTWGLRRMESKVARALFEYNAARSNRIYNPKTSGLNSENQQVERDRNVMMWEARDLIENFPVAREVPRKVANYLTVVEYSPSTGDKEYNKTVGNYFHDWCKRCDVTGRHSFKKLVQLAVEHRTVDGDCGFAIRRTPAGLRLQLVPATLIGNPGQIVYEPNYFQGVIVNNYGQPTAYRVFKVDRNGIYFDPEDVPAEHFVHYFDPFRCDQYRGVTDFHAAIRTARMLYEILEAEKVGVRFASQQAALVMSDRSTAQARNLFAPGNLGANGKPQQNEESDVGMIRYLGAGDKVEVMPGRPSSAFAGFVDHLMQEIALGVGWPAGVLYGTSGYKGPNVRAEFAAADRVAVEKRGVLIDKMADPIKDRVILDGIASGEIEAPKRQAGESLPQALQRATRGEWRFPARLSIDVGRESAANMAENRQGAKSLQEIAAEEGTDAFTRLDQIAAEAAYITELAEKYDLPETAIRMVTQQLPANPSMAAALGDNVVQGAIDAQAQIDKSKADTNAGKEPEPAKPVLAASAKDRIALALRGPSAVRLARSTAMVNRHERLAALRRRLGNQNANAEITRATFCRLTGVAFTKSEPTSKT
jgi:lambda family phage portal protein